MSNATCQSGNVIDVGNFHHRGHGFGRISFDELIVGVSLPELLEVEMRAQFSSEKRQCSAVR